MQPFDAAFSGGNGVLGTARLSIRATALSHCYISERWQVSDAQQRKY